MSGKPHERVGLFLAWWSPYIVKDKIHQKQIHNVDKKIHLLKIIGYDHSPMHLIQQIFIWTIGTDVLLRPTEDYE